LWRSPTLRLERSGPPTIWDYLDNGDLPRGQQVLRDHGMLLDVPQLAESPVVDGQLEPLWQSAAHVDSMFQVSRQHFAALPSDQQTDLYVAWRPEGLYVGIVCWDPDPEQLVVGVQHNDDDSRGSWLEDRLEVLFDPALERTRFIQFNVNSIGAKQDLSYPYNETGYAWNASGEWAAGVGEDHWSAEALLHFGPDMPRPAQNDMWGANFVRCFRGQEFAQWTRTDAGPHPEQFGILLFH
jgi:hypothetical protein